MSVVDALAVTALPLEDVEWDLLHHAYGAAHDTPGLLRRLAAPDLSLDEMHDIFGDLYISIFHQGSIYPATVATIPFLIALLDTKPDTEFRTSTLAMLRSLAIGGSWTDLSGFDIYDLRERVVQSQVPGYAEECARQLREGGTRDWRIDGALLQLQVYEAVRQGIQTQTYFRCLDDESAVVRTLTAHLIPLFPEDMKASQAALFTALEREKNVVVRGTYIVSLGILLAPASLRVIPEDVYPNNLSETPIVQLLLQLFDKKGEHDFVRFCCALGLAIVGFVAEKDFAILVRTATEETFLGDFKAGSKQFPYAVSGLECLAASTLITLKCNEHPSVPFALAVALSGSRGSATVKLADKALSTVFYNKPIVAKTTELPSFQALTASQQVVLRTLTEVDEFNWTFEPFSLLLRRWGLPESFSELTNYVRTGRG